MLPLFCVAQQKSFEGQDSTDYVMKQLSLSNDYLSSRAYEECIQCCNTIIDSHFLDEASQYKVLYNLGVSFINISQPDKALTYLEKACSMTDFTTPYDSYFLSHCYSCVGRYNDAIITRNEFIEYAKNSNDKDTQLLYAQALDLNATDYASLKDYKNAIFYQNECREIHIRMNEEELSRNDLYYLTLYKAMSGFYDNGQLINVLYNSFVNSNDLREQISFARCLSLLFDDNYISRQDSLNEFYYIEGLANYGKKDYTSAINYLEKARELYMHGNLCDSIFLNSTLLLFDSYMALGNLDVPEKYLRTAILRFIKQLEEKPNYAHELYSCLARVYEAKGETLWADRIHREKIQYYLIKDYLSKNPNDTNGVRALEKYKLFRYVDDQYNNLQGIYDESYIAGAESDGENMELIGALDEAKWCYNYCFRLSEKYISPFSESVMIAYWKLLNLYAIENDTEAFNALFPEAVKYAEDGSFEKYNEFSLAKIFGNTFIKQGNKEQAFNLYKKGITYLNSGKHIDDGQDIKTGLYMSFMAVCCDLGYYQEALECCDFLESNIPKDESKRYCDYKFNCFSALFGIGDYEKSLLVIEELEQMLKSQDSSSLFYYEVCLLKGDNFFLLGREAEAMLTYKYLHEHLSLHPDAIYGSERYIYNDLAFRFMSLGDYRQALDVLEKNAEKDINETGKISVTVQNYIDECKKHL